MLCITKMLHALQSVLMRTSCGGRTPAAESPMIRARALHRSRSLQQETGISFVMMFAVALGLAGADAARELPGEVAFIGTPAVVGNIKPEFRRELIAAGKIRFPRGKDKSFRRMQRNSLPTDFFYSDQQKAVPRD